MQGRTIPGITGLTQPSDGPAYSGLVSPKNQVVFTAYYTYSDSSAGSTPIANVQWTGDGSYWVALQGNTATCVQPAPVVVLPAFSTVTASVQASGTVFKANSGLYCL